MISTSIRLVVSFLLYELLLLILNVTILVLVLPLIWCFLGSQVICFLGLSNTSRFPWSNEHRNQYPHCMNSNDYGFDDNDYDVILSNNVWVIIILLCLLRWIVWRVILILQTLMTCFNLLSMVSIYLVLTLISFANFDMKSMLLQKTFGISGFFLIQPMHVLLVVSLVMISMVVRIFKIVTRSKRLIFDSN